MENRLNNLLSAEKSLKATLADLNRQWEAARAAGRGRMCVHIDRWCALTESLLNDNSAQIDALRAELESELAAIDATGELIDNIRAAAMDSGDWALWLDAEDELDILAGAYTNTLWDMIMVEHETIWGNEFAPDMAS